MDDRTVREGETRNSRDVEKKNETVLEWKERKQVFEDVNERRILLRTITGKKNIRLNYKQVFVGVVKPASYKSIKHLYSSRQFFVESSDV